MLPDNWLELSPQAIAALAPIQSIDLPEFRDKQLKVAIKREDLLHPLVGGNKLYKLHAYLREYRAGNQSQPIATFGGAYSNHIIAAAVAAKMAGIKIIGVIRGEEAEKLSPTLVDARAYGMRLVFVTRSEYRRRYDQDFIAELETKLGPCYWIPEGGAGSLGSAGMQGLSAAIANLAEPPNFVFHACGTGTSLAGLAAGFAKSDGKICSVGVAVLKGDTDLQRRVEQQIQAQSAKIAHWRLHHEYHGGGYAKLSDEMASFMQSFEKKTGILLDPVYTLKMLWAIVDLAKQNYFAPGTRILALHSGGLQGRRGFSICND